MLIKNDPAIIQSYLEDSSNLKGGYADEVAFPQNLEEISEILAKSCKDRTPVTVSGGGTGTVGSRIPFGGVALSMERMNKIISISEEEKKAIVQPGVSVDDFKKACEEKDLFYTSHPTERSASIGGTVSTNASGARSFKYGATRKYITRLKMVLSNGRIIEIRRGQTGLSGNYPTIKFAEGPAITVPMPSYKMPDVKNAAGYYIRDGMDAIDLFIGQEGTLSVICEIEIALVNRPFKILSIFVFFKREKDAQCFAADLRNASNMLSIEYLDYNALKLLKSEKFPKDAGSAIFFEYELVDSKEEESVLEKLLDTIARYNVSLDDTWVAMNEKDLEEFVRLRHGIPEAVNDVVRHRGFPKLSSDIAVPSDAFSKLVSFYEEAFTRSRLEHVIFGHIGECHLHMNILPRSKEELEESNVLMEIFAKFGVSLGGTVSAEHGIGKLKHKYLEIMYGRKGLLEMARIKKSLDPCCILGLDNIFPKEMLNAVT